VDRTEAAIVSAAALLEDTDPEVRGAVGDALAAIILEKSSTVSHAALAAVARRSDHADISVRVSSADAVAKIMPSARGEAVTVLLKGLEDPSEEVRNEVIRLSMDIPGKVDEELTAVMLAGCVARVEGGDKMARRSAVSVLKGAWSQGDPLAAAAVIRLCGHGLPHTRRAALQSLAGVAGGRLSGDGASSQAMSTAVLGLEDEVEVVRNAAAAALGELVGKSRHRIPGGTADAAREVLRRIAPCLDHARGDVRCAAVEAAGFAAGGALNSEVSAEVASTLLPFTQDTDEDVRWTAVRTLKHTGVRGDKLTEGALLRCLSDADEQVRIAAVEALARVAEMGDPIIMDQLKKMLEDHFEVARAALHTMKALFSKKDANSALAAAGITDLGDDA